MAQNITLMGASYTDVPAVMLPKTGGGEARFTDITPTTATDSDVASGKVYFKSDGTQSTGTASGGGGAYAWFGENAEKIDTKDLSFNLSSGTSYDSWTTSTTASAIKAASSSADYTLQMNLNNYDYCLVTKGFIEPVYASGTPTTYRTNRVAQYFAQYYYGYPSSSSISSVQNDEIDSINTSHTNTYLFIQTYYNSSGTLTARSATQCGPCYMTTYPTTTYTTASSGSSTLTYKLPAFNAKCDNNRFTTTRKGQVVSASTNYSLILEVYRVPHGKGLMSHWVSEMCNALNA